MNSALENMLARVDKSEFLNYYGKLTKVSNLIIEASGVDAFIGELCEIELQDKKIFAEVIALNDGYAQIMPYGDTSGIGLKNKIRPLNKFLELAVGEELLGRVIDYMGTPLDGNLKPNVTEKILLRGTHKNPLRRERISEVFETGVKAIDAFLPVGKGQRLGIFAGSGVGKSTLLGMIAKNSEADVNVIALIGERGREVNDFISNSLGKVGLEKSVVVVATADQPALTREVAAHFATGIAEYFCTQGKDVALIMDSISRFATAHREIGLAVGEPATARGYTPSVFAAIPRLIERTGNFVGAGSITSFYTVLVDGDDFQEPISDSMRAILDGHISLSRDLANHGHFPAIDLLSSISRLSDELWSSEERVTVKALLKALSIRAKNLDMIEIGAYKVGTNAEIDRAIELYSDLESFLKQDASAKFSRKYCFSEIDSVVAKHSL